MSDWELFILDARPGEGAMISLVTGDIDGNGQLEIIAGEHDLFWPYRAQCRLYVYKSATPAGRAWRRFALPGCYEHHDGTKAITLALGETGIISHGWNEDIYVHLWSPSARGRE